MTNEEIIYKLETISKFAKTVRKALDEHDMQTAYGYLTMLHVDVIDLQGLIIEDDPTLTYDTIDKS